MQPALKRLLDDPAVSPLIAQFFPDRETLLQTIASLRTIVDFQRVIMMQRVDAIVRDTMTRFTYSMSDWFDPRQCHLYVSNHRDIILDAMLLDKVLLDNGFDTPRVIFGSNLLTIPLMGELGRLNKLVSMDRGGSPRDFYRVLDETSHYIRQSITGDGQSVWIAQRNGRTKDGNDRTDAAVVKMLALSAPDLSLTEALSALHIVPVAVSYEWESCDLLKVRETCAPQPYVKRPDEDLQSVVTGFTQPKGQVHISIADPLTSDELAACHDDPQQVASLLDRRIHAAYKLHPTNLDPSLLQSRLALLHTEQERQALVKLYLTPSTHKKEN